MSTESKVHSRNTILAKQVNALPSTTPFKAPEAIEEELGRSFLLRLGANESNWGSSPLALRAAKDIAQKLFKYGDPESLELRTLISKKLYYSIDSILIGEGIDGLLALIIRAFIDPDDYVITTLGSYPTFNFHANGFGARLIEIPYAGDQVDLEGLLSHAIQYGAKLIYLANPDNPSGTAFDRDAIQSFIAKIPPSCVLILDEAYADFIPSHQLAQIDITAAPVIRLRTFSKAHGLAGIRVGYALAHPDYVTAFHKIRQHFGVNLAGQVLCAASLQDPDYIAQVAKEVSDGRTEYYRLAESLGLRAIPSSTNFVTIDVGSVEKSIWWVQRLAEEGVFIRRPGRGVLSQCIRITVGTKPERQLLAEIMRKIHAEH